MLSSSAPASTQRCLLSLVLLTSLTASAQQLATEVQSFPLERLRLSTNRNGLIDVESAALAPHLAWDVGLWLGYARNPLVLNRVSDDSRLGPLVSDRVGGSLFGSVGLFGFLEGALELPLIFYQGRPSDVPGALAPDTALATLASPHLGDVRALVKVRLLRQQDFGVNLALMPAITFPTGGNSGYFGERATVFAPEALLSKDFDHLRLGLNLGAVLRPRSEQLNQVVESELTGHFGVGYRFYNKDRSKGPPLEIDASLSTAISALRPLQQRNQNHVELRAMAAYDITRTLQLFAGTGLGLVGGWGTPDYRFFIGARYGRTPEEPVKVAEAPPPVDPDPDRDGLIAPEDRCPDQPGPRENGGCPDVDTDGDGLIDRLDGCPTQAEDKDRFGDEDGCPDPDNDGDGVLDAADRCPLEKGPAANQGCPDPDRDGDTVVDRLDNCPDEPGPVENQGCALKQLVIISEGRLNIIQNVYFQTNKDVIQPRSFRVLDNVVAVLKAHPEVTHVLVEGHTDNVGKPAKNQDLSERRARSVKKYLVTKGVDAARLEPKGFGQTKPIADNKTAAGREKNRRVVFTIVDGPDGIKRDDSGPAPEGTP